jgi:hypothetical protein
MIHAKPTEEEDVKPTAQQEPAPTPIVMMEDASTAHKKVRLEQTQRKKRELEEFREIVLKGFTEHFRMTYLDGLSKAVNGDGEFSIETNVDIPFCVDPLQLERSINEDPKLRGLCTEFGWTADDARIRIKFNIKRTYVWCCCTTVDNEPRAYNLKTSITFTIPT